LQGLMRRGGAGGRLRRSVTRRCVRAREREFVCVRVTERGREGAREGAREGVRGIEREIERARKRERRESERAREGEAAARAKEERGLFGEEREAGG